MNAVEQEAAKGVAVYLWPEEFKAWFCSGLRYATQSGRPIHCEDVRLLVYSGKAWKQANTFVGGLECALQNLAEEKGGA